MLITITSKRQVTFPAAVLNEMGVGPGDRLELTKAQGGYILTPRWIDLSKLGGLRDTITPETPDFNIREFRDRGYGPSAYRD